MAGLAISDVVNVDVVLAPLAVPLRNFGIMLLVGHTDQVISTRERFRIYATIDDVAADFSSTDPEYLAATLFFGQTPQPDILYIGRWAKEDSIGTLQGGILSASQQALANFTAITSGGFTITFDGGSPTVVSGLNLSGATNLNGVASLVQAALPVGATCIWNGAQSRFEIFSATDGATSTVSVMTATALSALLRGTTATGAISIDGIDAESALEGIQAIATRTTEWYAISFALAADNDLVDADYLAVAAYIEAANPVHIFGINTQDTGVLDPNDTGDIVTQLGALSYRRTLAQYSSDNLNAVVSIFGRMLTVDFTANNAMITVKFKIEPGVAAEVLTQSQAATLNAKHCNAFVAYEGANPILQQGVMVNGYFIDEVQGTDWLGNAIQLGVYNLLYTSPTKIPQTDAGVNQLMGAVAQACDAGVNNGLIAPGLWTGPNIGRLRSGEALPSGYYIYAPPVATQLQSIREQRIAPTIQAAIKLAGAIHFANVIVNVNR